MNAPTNTNSIIQQAQQAKAVAKKKQGSTLKAYIAKMQPEIAKALPSVMTPERFSRIVFSAISNNPQLAECTPESFLGAMMNAAQLGMEANTPLGQAYLIPFKNNKKGVMECQFQLGYKGLIDLAYRSGEVSVVQAHEVHEKDDFHYSFGLEPTLHPVPALHDRGDVIAYYAVFKTKAGGFGFEVMSKEDVQLHAQKFSQAYGSGPWQTNFDEMAKKTVLKKCLKYAPMKSEFARGVESDGSVKNSIAEDMSEVQDESIVYEVNGETGEIVGEKEAGADAD